MVCDNTVGTQKELCHGVMMMPFHNCKLMVLLLVNTEKSEIIRLYLFADSGGKAGGEDIVY